MLVKKLEKLVGKVKSEDVEEVSEIAFQLLKNMSVWNGKYETRLRKVLQTLMKENKQAVKKKLGMKMKE